MTTINPWINFNGNAMGAFAFFVASDGLDMELSEWWSVLVNFYLLNKLLDLDSKGYSFHLLTC